MGVGAMVQLLWGFSPREQTRCNVLWATATATPSQLQHAVSHRPATWHKRNRQGRADPTHAGQRRTRPTRIPNEKGTSKAPFSTESQPVLPGGVGWFSERNGSVKQRTGTRTGVDANLAMSDGASRKVVWARECCPKREGDREWIIEDEKEIFRPCHLFGEEAIASRGRSP